MNMGRIFEFQLLRIIILLLLSLNYGANASLVVHRSTNGSQNDLLFKASFAPTSPYPFQVTGRLYIMKTTELDELKVTDLDGAIVLSHANSSDDELRFVEFISERKGLGYVAEYHDCMMFYKNTFPLPFVCITRNVSVAISDLWEDSNRTVTATILSDDNYQITLGRGGGSTFLLVANLAILLVTLSYLGYQLHSFKDGAAVTKIALLSLLVANLGLIAERINVFLMIYTNLIPSTIPPPLAAIGPTFLTFAAVFISLYWTALTFPKMEKAKRKPVFLPILAFFIVLFILYTVCLGITTLKPVAFVVQVVFVVIIFIVATYFIVIGAILIRTLNKANKIVATKRKITKRLTYILILAGVSMYGVIVVSLFISSYSLSTSSASTTEILLTRGIQSESTFYSTRSILNLFSACSVAALAALFRRPKSPKHSAELKAGTSEGVIPSQASNDAR